MDKEHINTENNEKVESRNFIEMIIDKDLEEGRFDHVQTRFPPEPNGYLHIGHAKSILLNYGLAKEYNGKFNMRFDDTNPTKEKEEFVESILKDIKWLGADWEDRLFFASNYFEQMYEAAVKLIKKGKAYVCDLSPEEIREYRGTLTEPGKDSPYRDRTVEENLELFENMKNGVYKDGEKVLRVVKTEKIMEFDENTYVKLKDFSFHNGTIEVKMLSRLLPDAPDFARGFIGIAYRITDDDKQFESFYVRPTNGKQCQDPMRKTHGCQYFSYPKYTFEYFRNHQITQYEAPVDIDLNEWIQLKAVIEDEHASFYINDKLILVVEDMKHGKDLKGSVGFFVDIGTEAFFKDLKIDIK